MVDKTPPSGASEAASNAASASDPNLHPGSETPASAPRLDAEYWAQRYRSRQTGWDMGAASPALMRAFAEPMMAKGDAASKGPQEAVGASGDGMDPEGLDKDLPILIPGAGRAYEAEALHRLGYRQVHVLDWAEEPLQALRERVPDFPAEHLHQEDFFAHQAPDGAGYRVLIEQTFFCAIDPKRRPDYVAHAARLLAPRGVLLGLLFQDPLNDASHGQGPPYGGDAATYRRLFAQHFDLEHLATAEHSIPPRAGRELLIRARKAS